MSILTDQFKSDSKHISRWILFPLFLPVYLIAIFIGGILRIPFEILELYRELHKNTNA